MNDEQEKRMVGEYEITKEISVGRKEIVFGVNEQLDMPYFCAYYTVNEVFGSYEECLIGDDYVELMEVFADRIHEQCREVVAERDSVTVPREKITAEMCFSNDYGKSLVGKVVAVKPGVLKPEYRSCEHQLIYVTGGNGAKASPRGNACYHINLYSGEHGRWERYDIQGEVKPECLPQWAKERLENIRQKETEVTKQTNREVR